MKQFILQATIVLTILVIAAPAASAQVPHQEKNDTLELVPEQTALEPGWSFNWENDNIAFGPWPSGGDRFYTNGLLVTAVGELPEELEPLRDACLDQWWIPLCTHQSRSQSDFLASLSVGQTMHTPNRLETFNPNPLDRPYAGHLYLTGELTAASAIDTTFFGGVLSKIDAASATIGVFGGGSFAEDAQAGLHALKQSRDPKGWETQAQTRLTGALAYALRLNSRWEMGDFGGDITTEFTGMLGDPQTFLELGVVPRIGYNISGLIPQTTAIRLYEEEPANDLPRFRLELFGGRRWRWYGRNAFFGPDPIGAGPSVAWERHTTDWLVGMTIGVPPWALSLQFIERSPELTEASPFRSTHPYGVATLSRSLMGKPSSWGRNLTKALSYVVVGGAVGTSSVRVQGDRPEEARGDAHSMRISGGIRLPLSWGTPSIHVDWSAGSILAPEAEPDGSYADTFVATDPLRSFSLAVASNRTWGIGVPEVRAGVAKSSIYTQACTSLGNPDSPCVSPTEEARRSGWGGLFGFFYGIPLSKNLLLGVDGSYFWTDTPTELAEVLQFGIGLRFFPAGSWFSICDRQGADCS